MTKIVAPKETLFSKRLRKLREDKNLSQTALANNISGISRASISTYELGEKQPGIETLNKLADYFECSTDYLLGRTDAQSTNLEIKDLVEKTGLSEKAIDILYNRRHEIIGEAQRKILSYLIEYEAPPKEIFEWPNGIVGDIGDLIIRYDTNHVHIPILDALTKCIVFALNDKERKSLNPSNPDEFMMGYNLLHELSTHMPDYKLLMDTSAFKNLEYLVKQAREIIKNDIRATQDK